MASRYLIFPSCSTIGCLPIRYATDQSLANCLRQSLNCDNSNKIISTSKLLLLDSSHLRGEERAI